MRYSLEVELIKGQTNGEKLLIRNDYRRDITRFIKSCLEDSYPELFEIYYGERKKNKSKPFTFSVNFPCLINPSRNENSIEITHNKLEIIGNKCKIHFSFCDYNFAISLYNAMLYKKDNPQIFSGITHKIKRFYMRPKVVIRENTVVFRTLSPILVRNLNDNKGNGFLKYTDDNFIPNLIQTIKNIVKNHLGNGELSDENIHVEILKMKADRIMNYGGELGNSGILKITAPVEVLQLLYDAGCSAKKSQGFGMLEVVG